MLRLSSGERVPLLIARRSGLPDSRTTAYTLSVNRTKSWNTAKHHLDAIGLFYEWAKTAGIDLNERFGTAELFNQEEIDGLAAALRMRRPSQWKSPHQPAVVIADSHANRINAVAAFMRWRAQGVIQAMRLTDPRLAHAPARLEACLHQLASRANSGGSKKRHGLTEDEQRFLLNAIRPDSPHNPFSPTVRLRNFAIILMLFELGLRRGETLLLKPAHVMTAGTTPHIKILPSPNDPDDPRVQEPRLKTSARLLFISPILASAIDDYVMHERRLVPNAKKARFLFLETTKGRPLALATLYDFFRILRDRFPSDLPLNFSPHVLRHTFNGRFTAAARGRGLNANMTKLARNHVLGWKMHSDQGADYDDAEVKREVEGALFDLQDELTGLLS